MNKSIFVFYIFTRFLQIIFLKEDTNSLVIVDIENSRYQSSDEDQETKHHCEIHFLEQAVIDSP